MNAQIPEDDGEKADHDFDVVTHNFCNYKDDGKGLQIDVEKIVGDAADGVSIFWYSNFKTFIATFLPPQIWSELFKISKMLTFQFATYYYWWRVTYSKPKDLTYICIAFNILTAIANKNFPYSDIKWWPLSPSDNNSTKIYLWFNLEQNFEPYLPRIYTNNALRFRVIILKMAIMKSLPIEDTILNMIWLEMEWLN